MSHSEHKRSWWQRTGYQIARVALWCCFKLFYGYRVEGRENFPTEGAALICANHQSHLDPMLVGTTSPRRMNFLAKKELFQVPLLRQVIRFLDSIPIDREGASSAAGLKETLKRLKRQEMVLMFPEGKRTLDGALQPIMPGFVMLVKRTQVPLIPVGVSGAFRAWPRHRRWPLIGPRIRIVIGSPIHPSDYADLSDQAIIELLERRLREVFQQAESR